MDSLQLIAGVLALPFAFYLAGWALGFFILLFAAVVNTLTLIIILRGGRRFHASSYQMVIITEPPPNQRLEFHLHIGALAACLAGAAAVRTELVPSHGCCHRLLELPGNGQLHYGQRQDGPDGS